MGFDGTYGKLWLSCVFLLIICGRDQVYYTDQVRKRLLEAIQLPAHIVTSPAALWIQPRAMETAYCDPDGVET